MDVWSFDSVVYAILMGKSVAQAATGAGVVVCWLGALGKPCFDAGCVAHPQGGMSCVAGPPMSGAA